MVLLGAQLLVAKVVAALRVLGRVSLGGLVERSPLTPARGVLGPSLLLCFAVVSGHESLE
ncbi:unannotated protein [freshwater metagenome]|uniref:Unannotated protein n=1 Tax=freshwater metagenome TaxID=449393 RepID=A0A6J6Y3G2_9ZZZZ|nr:hypothetical protein [Actinomycetota bacterium]